MTAPGRAAALLSLTSLLSLAARPGAAMSSAEARQLAGACASCHRPGGHGDPIPAITGLEEERTVSLMHAYQADARRSQVMHVVAAALSTEEIEAVAHYLAQQAREAEQAREAGQASAAGQPGERP